LVSVVRESSRKNPEVAATAGGLAKAKLIARKVKLSVNRTISGLEVWRLVAAVVT
jgi:hypothetical protein